ncbi:H(+)-transporting two-sector ATPase [Handroanthus impetiginosus]|uniref:H(+)-transporting two-sector ATPase n=1 Tax=Handroanthus impetiginosus TaxID=429701 RepID=A0A2G9HFB1_9LAMI|nr:H(+)-transporting two-sector ATPase [Handroanthus impetiginosus]
MAHRGEVKATVTSVIPLPEQEEKELKETLQNIPGQGKQVKLEKKIDPNILGGLVVEFGQKVFDMSIKTRAAQMERFLCEPTNLDGK